MACNGIILAGGESLRMGQDKGLAVLHNKPLITYAIAALKPLVTDILIIADPTAYKHFGYPVYPDQFPDSGPLGGIVTGLQRSNTAYNVVMSCDTPFVSTGLLRHLLSQAQSHDVILPVHEGREEPLTALYHQRCLALFEELIADKALKLRNAVKQVTALEVNIDQRFAFYHERLFDNLNTPEALVGAELWFQGR